MLYIWMANMQPGLSREQIDEALTRRAAWKYPDNIKVLGEYWPLCRAPVVITIFETDDFEGIMELMFSWGDKFEITCVPACTAEQGLQLGPAILERRSA
jgi:hypothetical protein